MELQSLNQCRRYRTIVSWLPVSYNYSWDWLKESLILWVGAKTGTWKADPGTWKADLGTPKADLGTYFFQGFKTSNFVNCIRKVYFKYTILGGKKGYKNTVLVTKWKRLFYTFFLRIFAFFACNIWAPWWSSNGNATARIHEDIDVLPAKEVMMYV